MPPQKKDIPSTKSKLESTEPSSVAFTTCVRPARRVCTMITISTALPKVAFRRPASMSFFSPAASSSVASPRIFARGTKAMKLSQKVVVLPHPNPSDAKPRGKENSRQLMGCMSMLMIPTASLLGGFCIVVPLMNRLWFFRPIPSDPPPPPVMDRRPSVANFTSPKVAVGRPDLASCPFDTDTRSTGCTCKAGIAPRVATRLT
mmetsp:Transcript_23010/g.48944  ORF Transcript_23010/g.48944 Transcript_23010/m.48944 type:complete len:203 (-) Transcript_23010:4-612(-)